MGAIQKSVAGGVASHAVGSVGAGSAAEVASCTSKSCGVSIIAIGARRSANRGDRIDVRRRCRTTVVVASCAVGVTAITVDGVAVIALFCSCYKIITTYKISQTRIY